MDTKGCSFETSADFNLRFSVLHNFTTCLSAGLSRRDICVTEFFFFYLVYEAIGTAATPGLLSQPRVIMKMIVKKQMECRLAGETEILGENLLQRYFRPSQNPT
jgi:hypothetical protein